MTDSNSTKPTIARIVIRYVITLVVCALLVVGTLAVLRWIDSTEPTAEREGATRKTAALVDTLKVSRGTYAPELVALGRVSPEQEIDLGALVAGEIIQVDPSYDTGEVVEAGQLLMKIDPADYENQLLMRESELEQVKAQLVIEQGSQAVAKKELEALGRDLDPAKRALVLREPQINTLLAQIKAKEAEVGQAKLELKRTEIRAPFHAQILSRRANLGMQVNTGSTIARLVGLKQYHIRTSVPLRHLEMLKFSQDGAPGSVAMIHQPAAWGPGVARQGVLTRLVGELDPESRLAQVLITVQDPLALQTDGPKLLLDSIVQVTLKGEPLQDVIRLPRELLRQNDTVWVNADDKLSIRKVTVVFGNADFAYIKDGLEDGDEVVTTSLATVIEGRPLRRMSDKTQEQAPAGDGS